MIGLFIGFVIGATVATNYNLMPFYIFYIKPTLDTTLKQIKDHMDKYNNQANNNKK